MNPENIFEPAIGAASLQTAVGNFIKNPIVIAIIVVIAVILVGMWVADKVSKKNAKPN